MLSFLPVLTFNLYQTSHILFAQAPPPRSMRTSIIFLLLALFTTSSFAASHGNTLEGHFGLGRRDSSGDCSTSAIAAGGLCAVKCPANEIPQLDGTCACPSSYHIVKHGAIRKRICQPHCSRGYVLSSDFTSCVCGPTSFISHDKTKCWSHCPEGTYALASKQTNTPGSCPSCLDPGVATCVGRGPGFALTCNAVGHNEYYLDPTTKSCVMEQHCPVGTYADFSSKSCLYCVDFGATSCSGGGPGEALTCGNNAEGIPTYLDPEGGYCFTSCVEGFYGTSTLSEGNICTLCGENQATCNENGALTCSSGFLLDPVALACVSECPVSTFAGTGNDGSPTCTSCGPVEVLSCTDASTASTCGPNSDGDLTYLNSNNQCVTSCGDGFYAFTSVETKRLVKRPYHPPASDSCRQCDDGTATCIGSGNGNALSCDNFSDQQYYLDSTNTCVTQCGPGTYNYGGPGTGDAPVCSACGANALTCQDANTAYTCVANFYFYNSQCLTSCPSEYNSGYLNGVLTCWWV